MYLNIISLFQVFEGDGLPNKICHPCRYQLEKSYTFRKKCEHSDLKLRQHLKELKEKLGCQDISQVSDIFEGADTAEPSTSESTVIELQEGSTEQDLVGVTQVTYIQPDPEPEDDPESITLKPDTDESCKEACTLGSDIKKEMTVVEDTLEQVILLFLHSYK